MSSSKTFSKFTSLAQRELEQNYPNIMNRVSDISIGFAGDSAKGVTNPAFKLSPASMAVAEFATRDSAPKKDYWANEQRQYFREDVPAELAVAVRDSIVQAKQAGLNEAQARAQASALVDTYMTYDSASNQLVFKATPKGTKDSLLSQTSIPFHNIGYLTKIFKQPYAPSYASNLVSVESFGNAWIDVVGVYKETFEGMARVSNAASSTFEATSSDPVTNQIGAILSQIFNIAVDYEISNEEQNRAGAGGNFMAAAAIADRPRYADMVMNRLKDVIRYFGVPEAGVIGLTGVNAIVDYAGASLSSIVAGASTTKGADIINVMYDLISDFLLGMRYLPTEVKIHCSTRVFRALTATLYSDGFNPTSPIKILSDNMAGGVAEISGAKQCKWTLTADAMLDEDSPYNTVAAGDDLFIITAPSIGSAFEDQTGLVISPEPLSRYIVPPMYQRSGYLYTMYTRMGGLITPIKSAVKVYKGVGVQA